MERRAITVRGIVQGVGFRPYVYHLALRCRLTGFVRNAAGAVHIEVEGARGSLARFCTALNNHPPPLSAVEQISWNRIRCRGDTDFHIARSAAESTQDVLVSPDVATCSECLAELFNPADRRYRYPFLNCTHCGPRLTIVAGAPYDRGRTTMAPFAMCPQCRAEYENPADRRFHAQATCCPDCGPRLRLCASDGRPLEVHDPLQAFAAAVSDGGVGALKGLGGYHLVCDAANERAVAELRRRKQRDAKPLAIMVAGVEHAERLCQVSTAERELLQSLRRPIVLLERKQDSNGHPHSGGVVESVAPGNPYLGVLLPYTPLHHLLLDAVGGRPLVMTSGNRSDEPIAYQDQAAIVQLGEIADLFLSHDREIHVRTDDSVTRVVGGAESPVRRSRGNAPRPVKLPVDCPIPTLAVGGQLKNTFALGRGRFAFLSHHLGDLDHYEAYREFERDVALYEELFGIHPQLIVHDLHPDYATTGYARRRVADGAIQTLAVQHHHAHVASCMAEHGLAGDVIGVAFDGTGLGTDGAIWGGEFLVADYRGFRRAAHLRYVPLPGGDQAIRQPWRSAATHAIDAGCDLAPSAQVASPASLRTVRQMIERRVNSPLTSSAGRLFDAVAALVGIRSSVSFEGQAAMELEWLATAEPPDGAYPIAISAAVQVSPQSPCEIDTRPMFRAIAEDLSRGTDKRRIARRFQTTLVELIATVCQWIRCETGLNRVVLSGGVFMNVLLARESTARLATEGFEVFRHRLVPPNDGGLSLGQLAVGAAVSSPPGDSSRQVECRIQQRSVSHGRLPVPLAAHNE